jgi:hypothetical protein
VPKDEVDYRLLKTVCSTARWMNGIGIRCVEAHLLEIIGMSFHDRRPSSLPEDATIGAVDYLRRARRLRHRLRHNPARLHACLRKLTSEPSTPVTVARAVPAGVAGPLQADPIAMLAFTDEVTDALDGCVLRYSNRLSLLARAADLGISRFEANLIIATVQHRCETPPPPPTAKSYWPTLIVVVIALQAAIVLMVWRLFGV